jgi:nicotinamidase-related amidase
MASQSPRDPVTDHLLTPQNAALVVIDYQPSQVQTVTSRDDFEVFPVVDAVGGTSPEAHRSGLERIGQAGAQPISWVSLACELQRDWARVDTVAGVVDIVLTTRLLASV